MNPSSGPQPKFSWRALVDSYSCYPLFIRKAQDPVARIHFLATQYKYVDQCGLPWDTTVRPPVWRRLVARAIWTMLVMLRLRGLYTLGRKEYGRSRAEAVGDVMRAAWMAWFRRQTPMLYYRLRFYRPCQRAQADRFLPSWEFGALTRYFSFRRGSYVGALDQKHRFNEFCQFYGLPHIPSLSPEQFTTSSDADFSGDMFVKGVGGFGGSDCRRVDFDVTQGLWKFEEKWHDRASLSRNLARLAEHGDVVIQPLVRNHPVLRRVAPCALSTIRILTAWSADRGPVPLRASLRMSRGDPKVDNFSKGGIAAPMDLVSGTLGQAVSIFESTSFSMHPVSGERIEGLEVPHGKEALELCARAHGLAGNYNFLAWDVAITSNGALLVECNVWPEAEVVQVPQGEPLLSDELLPYFVLELEQMPHASGTGARIDRDRLKEVQHSESASKT